MEKIEQNIVDKLRQRQAERQAAALTTYATLVRKVAGGEKLTAGEEKTLDGIIADERITVEQLEADIQTVREYIAALQSAAVLPMLEAEQRKLDAQSTEANARFAEVRAKHQAELDTIAGQSMDLSPRIAMAEVARAKAAELAAAHWRVLGLPDPSVKARQRHLLQTLNKHVDHFDGVEVLSFEWLMMNPESIASRLDRYAFIPAPGQTQAELDDLLNRARAMADRFYQTKRSMNVYLLRSDAIAAATGHPKPAMAVEDVKRQRLFDPYGYNFERAPGQSRQELDALIAEVERAGQCWHEIQINGDWCIRPANHPTKWAREQIAKARKRAYGESAPAPVAVGEEEPAAV